MNQANVLSALRSPASWRTHLNTPLLVGGALVLVLVGCALAAPLLAPHDPLEAIVRFNGPDLVKAPYPPGTLDIPLGSDMERRDMLSRLIYGSRYTLLFAGVTALVRLLIGVALGVAAAWLGWAARPIDVLAAASSAIPSLVFGLVVVFVVRRNDQIGMTLLIAALLGLTGWSEIAVRCKVAVRELRRSAFVEAAETVGAGSFGIVRRHILPNLRNLLLPEATYAMTASLLLIAELGFLRVFIGGVDEDGVPLYAEWGQMIATGFRARSNGWWLIWEPMAVFALTILAFYLLAEGLRRRS